MDKNHLQRSLSQGRIVKNYPETTWVGQKLLESQLIVSENIYRSNVGSNSEATPVNLW